MLVGLFVSCCVFYKFLVVFSNVLNCVVIILNFVGKLKMKLLVLESLLGVMIGMLFLGGVFILLSIFFGNVFGICLCMFMFFWLI